MQIAFFVYTLAYLSYLYNAHWYRIPIFVLQVFFGHLLAYFNAQYSKLRVFGIHFTTKKYVDFIFQTSLNSLKKFKNIYIFFLTDFFDKIGGR